MIFLKNSLYHLLLIAVKLLKVNSVMRVVFVLQCHYNVIEARKSICQLFK